MPIVSIIVKFLFKYGRVLGTYARHIYSVTLQGDFLPFCLHVNKIKNVNINIKYKYTWYNINGDIYGEYRIYQ